jgi:uncharacterized membrane protein YfhO
MKEVTKLLSVFPYIAIMVLMNTFIVFTIAAVVVMQMIYFGYNRYFSLATAVLVAAGVHCYIAFNHKIRNKIKESQ